MQCAAIMLELHTWTTPNGKKPAILLAELNLTYELHLVDISQGEQKRPAFLELSPNGKIPALVDTDPVFGKITLFESGAILQYIAEKYGRFLPHALGQRRAEVLSWLYWQVGGPGPFFGQLHKFDMDKPRDDLAFNRFEKEAKRLIGVLDRQLENREFVAEEYSIADMACFPWFAGLHGMHKELFDSAVNVRSWLERVGARPAVKRGMNLAGAATRLAHNHAA